MDAFDRAEVVRQAEVRAERQWQAINHPANRAALDELKLLLAMPGRLKIITEEPDPAGADYDPRNPRFWISHDVVRIEGPDHNGNVWAYSREGDHAHAHAHALLGRLSQYVREAPFAEPRQPAMPGVITVEGPIRSERPNG